MNDYEKLIELKNAIQELIEIPVDYADKDDFLERVYQVRANVREILKELPLILP